jgi:Alpha-galactosidase
MSDSVCPASNPSEGEPSAATPALIEELARHPLGSMVALYERDAETGAVGLVLYPKGFENRFVRRRTHLSGVAVDAFSASLGAPLRARRVDSLLQIQERTDSPCVAFGQGRTMRGGGTVEKLRFRSQEVSQADGARVIATHFSDGAGRFSATHELRWIPGTAWVESAVTVTNTGDAPITLDFLAGFSLGNLSPFADGDTGGRLRLHRFRTAWSSEGQLESRTPEDLHLERSWAGWGVRCERFGAVGSMPVNGFFPTAVVEDIVEGVCWAAALWTPGSWQMEFYRRDDSLSFSGGLADREFGHWTKMLAPGETFRSPKAVLACVAGGVDAACQALLGAQEAALDIPQVEEELPVIFNEWATSWGRPSHDGMVRLAARLRDTGIRYLVLDAGWFCRTPGEPVTSHGDWIPNREMYPQGLEATMEAIRAEGLIPGLWFEMETVGEGAEVFQRTELLLHRDGRPLTVGPRRFLDFRNPAAHAYLAERMIALMERLGVGYLKVDYNENIGFGVDGAESPGEGLRQHLEGVQEFFRRIRRVLPNLVIENCASGGHRLEASLMALASMGSFSDAHENPEIPLIAANLHRLILPRQSQIWAALRADESPDRAIFSISAGFLGRLCFSGDFLSLSPWQEQTVRRAVELYRAAAPIIRSGTSEILREVSGGLNAPHGWQCVLRRNGAELLVVQHRFASENDAAPLGVSLPEGSWRVRDGLWKEGEEPCVAGRRLVWENSRPWTGSVVLLEKTD